MHGRALFTGRVLLPADTVLLMRPWGVAAQGRFPDFRATQNQMHGPIYEYYSWRQVARDRLRGGQVPLWNPDELAGNVLLANSQSAVLYPPNALLWVLPLWLGVNLVTVLHTFLTGLFSYLLLRRAAMLRPAALLGAVVWMLCGLLAAWTEFQTPTAALCWLPVALWAWEAGRGKGSRLLQIGGSGGALALCLLAGHLHFAFYVFLGFGLYVSWRDAVRGAVLRTLASLGASVALAVVLSLATMLPVFEMSRHNFRADQPSYSESIALRLPPANLLTLALPNLLGNPRDHISLGADGHPEPGHAYFGQFDFIEYCAYLGVIPLLLAPLGLLRRSVTDRNRRSVTAGMAIIGAVGLLLALGTPLCALFFYLAPGYRQFHATARALCLASFAAAALAAGGLDVLLTADDAGRALLRRRLIAGAGVVLAVAALAFPVLPTIWPSLFPADKPGWQQLLSDQWFGYVGAGWGRLVLFLSAGLAVALATRSRTPRWGWALPALAAADLLVWGWGFNPATDPAMLGGATTVGDFLSRTAPARVLSLESPDSAGRSMIIPNYNAVVGYREVQGADSLHLARYHDLIARTAMALAPSRRDPFPEPNTVRLPAADHPVLDLLNVRWVTTAPTASLPNDRFHRALDAELTVWENPRANGTAWVAGRAEIARDAGAVLSRLSDPSFDARATALLATGPLPPTGGRPGSVLAARIRPHECVYETQADGPGILVASEIDYPGWNAYVDGRPAPVRTAFHVLRAVQTPGGRCTVVFRYEPTSWRAGLYASLAALAALVALIVRHTVGRSSRGPCATIG